MKINHLCCIIFFLYINCNANSGFFDVSEAYTIQGQQDLRWIAFFNTLYAQKEIGTGKFPIKIVLEGYIVHEPYWDSRQILATGNGLKLFAPRRKIIGTNGKDINATGEASMSVIETRWRLKLWGPKVLGAELFGLLEADFADSAEAPERMDAYHAYAKLTWKDHNSSLLFGLFYHPIRVAHIDIEPKIIGRNRGAPLHPIPQNPQCKFTKHWDNNLNFMVAALAQVLPRSLGPIGPTTEYVRRTMMPIFDAQLWYGPIDTHYIAGIGFDARRFMPRLVTVACDRTRETFSCFACYAFGKLTADPLSIRTQLVWAQNGADYELLGGYGISSFDPITGRETYTNVNILSYWVDFNVDTKISPGLFGGITRNLGTSKPLVPLINPLTGIPGPFTFDVGQDIKYMVRVVPRVRFHFKPLIFGAELEWTRAGWGTLQPSGKIENVQPVSNVRLLLASYLFY